MLTRFIRAFILTALLGHIKAQSMFPLSLGAGVNSTFFFGSPYYFLPSLPVSPYLNFKIKKSEFIVGVDFYPWIKKSTIIGAQAGYRYHFLRNKPLHLFIDCNLQYVGYQAGCGEPVPYDAPYVNHCADGDIYKVRSVTNTYGLGLQLTLLKRLALYAIIGGGINHYKTTGNGYLFFDQDQYQPTAYLRLGLSFDIYQRKSNYY